MTSVKPRVDLITRTENPEEVVYSAFRQCYYKGFVGDKIPEILNYEISKESQEKLIRKVIKSGHESPLEHVSFTFGIDGVSRSLTHQLVRHRIASYSQQSQRYTGEGDYDYVIPKSIEENKDALEEYKKCMTYIINKYRQISKILEDRESKKASKEDARYVLPNAAVTRIVVTMNCRSLMNFFALRLCSRAQWEIRELAEQMLTICKRESPILFENAGPRCMQLGFCPEEKGCGWMPTFQELVSKE